MMKKQVKSLSIVDQMLKYASELRMEDMGGETEITEEMTGTYSAEFDSSMSAYFKKLKRKNSYKHAGRILTRVAVILLAFIAVSTTVVMSVDAFRVPALEFFGQADDGVYSAHVMDETGIYDSIVDQVKGFYLPTYVPEGYKVDYLDNLGSWYYNVSYKNDGGGFIAFQNLSENSSVMVNNNGVQKEVPVKDQTGKLFTVNGQSVLLFKYQKNAFMITGTIDEDDIIHMAESLEYYK